MKTCCPGNREVRLYTGVRALPDDWDCLLPAGHFLHQDSLAVYEQCGLPDVSFVYALICRDGQPVAAADFQLLHIRKEHVSDAMLASWRKPL